MTFGISTLRVQDFVHQAYEGVEIWSKKYVQKKKCPILFSTGRPFLYIVIASLGSCAVIFCCVFLRGKGSQFIPSFQWHYSISCSELLRLMHNL